MTAKKIKNDELMFRGRPVTRRGDVIYYGFIDDDFIVKLSVKEKEDIGDISAATKVKVQLTTNTTHLEGKERMIKQAERDGLFSALDFASVWLDDVMPAE